MCIRDRLRTLNLNQNKLDAEDARALANSLMKTTAMVTSVDLRANSIGDDGVKAIAEALKINAVLTTLVLDYNSIRDEGAIAIAEALKVNAVLTELWLGGNNIGDTGANAIADALKSGTAVVLNFFRKTSTSFHRATR